MSADEAKEMDSALWPLELDRIEYRARNQRLLGPLTLRFDPGAPSVIIGPNGAGKSLALRIAHGLLEPTAGRVRWGPARQSASDAIRRAQAMVFQRPVVLRRSARANLEYALSLRGLARAERVERADWVLDKTGLSAVAARPARRLSVGEQQRLAIARAWAGRPRLLFLDEPSASLDPAATAQIESLIGELVQDGTKIVMTTHDLGQARRLADDVLLLVRGGLCERAPAARFFDAPETEEAKRFLRGDLLS